MSNLRARLKGALLLITAATLAACDNPVRESDPHTEAEGVVVRSGELVVLRVLEGAQTGELIVGPGMSRGPLTVRFLDHDGDEIEPDANEYLEVVIGDTDVARWESQNGAFTGSLVGVASGQTTITFRLMHGTFGSGHADATIPGAQDEPVRVTVSP